MADSIRKVGGGGVITWETQDQGRQSFEEWENGVKVPISILLSRGLSKIFEEPICGINNENNYGKFNNYVKHLKRENDGRRNLKHSKGWKGDLEHYGNDKKYDHVFQKPVKVFGTKGM